MEGSSAFEAWCVAHAHVLGMLESCMTSKDVQPCICHRIYVKDGHGMPDGGFLIGKR